MYKESPFFPRMTLKWLCTATNISEGMEAGWTNMVNLKDVIIQLVDSDNDGVRTVAIKFMEMVVLTQTHRGPSSAPKVHVFFFYFGIKESILI